MKFVFPTIAYKEKAIDFIAEFRQYGSATDGSGSLAEYHGNNLSYEESSDNVMSTARHSIRGVAPSFNKRLRA